MTDPVMDEAALVAKLRARANTKAAAARAMEGTPDGAVLWDEVDDLLLAAAHITAQSQALVEAKEALKEMTSQRDQAVRLANLSKGLLDDANEECASLRDALENLSECLPLQVPYANWLPMETAPKTGSQIIYRYMDGAHARAGLMCWMQTFSATESAEDTPCWWDLGLDDEAHKPTGWIPFPGGPA